MSFWVDAGDIVWCLRSQREPAVVVEENNLTVMMSALRKALGESPGQHTYIVTLPGTGYRFVAQVAEIHDSPSQDVGDGP